MRNNEGLWGRNKLAYVGITIDVKLGHNANDAVLISFREVGRETEMRF